MHLINYRVTTFGREKEYRERYRDEIYGGTYVVFIFSAQLRTPFRSLLFIERRDFGMF